jgi:WW domain
MSESNGSSQRGPKLLLQLLTVATRTWSSATVSESDSVVQCHITSTLRTRLSTRFRLSTTSGLAFVPILYNDIVQSFSVICFVLLCCSSFQTQLGMNPNAMINNDMMITPVAATALQPWGVQIGTSSNDRGVDVAVDPSDSSIVVAGVTLGALFDTNQGGFDLFVSKLNSSGSIVWQYQTGSSVDDYAVTVAMDPSNSSIIVAGNTLGALFDANQGGFDIFVSKLNNNGSAVWQYQTGSSADDYAYAAAVDPSDSSVIIVGSTLGSLTVGGSSAGSNDIFAIKLNSSGSEMWRYQIGSSAPDYVRGVSVDPSDSSIILSGYTQGTLFGTARGADDIFVAKLNAAGSEVWRYQTGTSNYDYAFAVAVDHSDSSIVITGRTRGSLSVASPNQGLTDVFVIKLNAAGCEVWIYQTGTSEFDYSFDVAVDQSDSSIVLTGYTLGDLVGPNQGSSDIFVIRLDSDGLELWGYSTGTDSSDTALAVAVDPSDSGGIIITGVTTGSLFGPDHGGNDIFVSRLIGRLNTSVFSASVNSVQDESVYSATVYTLSAIPAGQGTHLSGVTPICVLCIPSHIQLHSSVNYTVVMSPSAFLDSAVGFAHVCTFMTVSSHLATTTATSVPFINILAEDTTYDVYTSIASDPLAKVNAKLSEFTTDPLYVLPVPSLPDWNFEAAIFDENTGRRLTFIPVDVAISSIDHSSVTAGYTTRAVATGRSKDVFVMKVDAGGSEMWRYQVDAALRNSDSDDDLARAVAVDPSDANIVLVGSTEGVLFAGDSSFGATDLFVMKLNSGGQEIWAQQLGTNVNDYANAVAVDAADSSIVLAGHTVGVLTGTNKGSYDIFVMKRSSAGSPEWVFQTGTPSYDIAHAVAVDATDSSIITAGYTNGQLFANASRGNEDVVVLKLSAAGQLVWQVQIGTPGLDFAYGVALCSSDSSIVVSGNTNGAMRGAEFPNEGGLDIFAIKLNSTGSEVWRYQLGSSSDDNAWNVAVSPINDIIVIAGYSGGTLQSTSSYGGQEVVVLALSRTGEPLWIYQTGSNSDDMARGVAVDSTGHVLVTGTTLTYSGLFVMNISSAISGSDSLLHDVTASTLTPTSALVDVRGYSSFLRDIPFQICMLTVPSDSLSLPQNVPWSHVANADSLSQYVVYSQQQCTLDITSNGEFATSVLLTHLRSNTRYTIVAVFSLDRVYSFVSIGAFTTSRATLSVGPILIPDSPSLSFSLAQRELQLSVSVTLEGVPHSIEMYCNTVPPQKFFDTGSTTPRIAVPINTGGTPLTSTLQLGSFPMHRQPALAPTLGNMTLPIVVNVTGIGIADIAPSPALPWLFNIPVSVYGTLLTVQQQSTVLAITATISNAEVEFEIYPPPLSGVTLTLVTIGGAPLLPFFLNRTASSLLPNGTAAQFTSTASVVRRTWSLNTETAYAASLILQPRLTGPDSDLVTSSSQIHLHIRSAVQCRAVLRSNGMAVSPLSLYVHQSSADIPHISVACSSSLRFVTSDTLVLVELATSLPQKLTTSVSSLELSLAAPNAPFSVSTTSTGMYTVSFAVTTASAQLDPSFFPVNPDGYAFEVQALPLRTLTVSCPRELNLSAATSSVDGEALLIVLSAAPVYNVTVTPVSPDGSLSFTPPHLTFTVDPVSNTSNGPLQLTIMCRTMPLFHVGQHIIHYTMSGPGAPGFKAVQSTVVHIYGEISIDPPIDILYVSSAAPSRQISVSSLPDASSSAPRQLTVQLECTRSPNGGYIDIVPSNFTFSLGSPLVVQFSKFQFTGATENGTVNITAHLGGNASHLYSDVVWMVHLETTSPVYVSADIGLGTIVVSSDWNVYQSSTVLLSSAATVRSTKVNILVALASWVDTGVYYGASSQLLTQWTYCGAMHSSNGTFYRALPVYKVVCIVEPGTGGNYRIGVAVESTDHIAESLFATTQATISYPHPTIADGTLRLLAGDFGDSHVFGSSVSASDTVYFSGSHFGLIKGDISVTFGPMSDPTQFTCQVVHVNDTVLGCQMLFGQGINLVFRVNAGGQIAVGNDRYSYPNAPSITAVQGCSSAIQPLLSDSVTRECPTLGFTVLTVWGVFFADTASAMNVFVGGSDCQILSVVLGDRLSDSNDMLTCMLPAGSGEGRELQISRVFGDVTLTSSVTIDTPRISYAEPVILSIMSPNCTSTSVATKLVDCPRGSTTLNDSDSESDGSNGMVIAAEQPTVPLTINGRHFGNASVVVIVGSVKCIDPRITVIDTAFDAQRIVCQMPLSQDTNQPVLILVPNGATNQESPSFVSFKQCPAGTYEESDTSVCIDCSRYEYQQSPGKPTCDACPTNQYKASTDRSQALCALCPKGGVCGQRLPVQSEDGYWLSPQHAGNVLSYACLQDRCTHAFMCFPSEALMVSTGLASVSCCSSGRLPASQNPLCGECLAGYSEWSHECIVCDSTRVDLVLVYVLLGYAILIVIYHITSVTSGAKFKVVVLFAQTIHAFVSSDPSFHSVFGAVASLNPLGSSQSCVTPISGLGEASLPMIQLLLLYLLLLSLMLFNGIAWLIHRCVFMYRMSEAHKAVSFPPFKLSAFRRVTIALISISFIPIFKATVLLGKCVDVISPSGQTLSLLEEYPSVGCSDATYRVVYALSVSASIFVVVVICSFVVLYGQKRYLMYADLRSAQIKQDIDQNTASNSICDNNNGQHRHFSLYAEDDESRRLKKFIESRYGFLFKAFRAGKWTASWQAVLMIRSVCLVLASALVEDWRTKFTFLTMLACIFLAVHLYFMPYHYHSWDNQMETAALVVLVCFGLLNSTQWYGEDSVRMLSLLFYYGFLVCWSCVFMYLYWKAGKCHIWHNRYERAKGVLSRHLSRSSITNDGSTASGVHQSSSTSSMIAAARPGVETELQQQQPSQMKWAWWQYLFGWYLAPRSRYEPRTARDAAAGVDVMLRRMSSYRRPTGPGVGSEYESNSDVKNVDQVQLELNRQENALWLNESYGVSASQHSAKEIEMEETPQPTRDSMMSVTVADDDVNGQSEQQRTMTSQPWEMQPQQHQLYDAASGRTATEAASVERDPDLPREEAAAIDSESAQLANQWTEYATDDGIPYYFNASTGETQWEKT